MDSVNETPHLQRVSVLWAAVSAVMERPQEFISHCSGGLAVTDQGAQSLGRNNSFAVSSQGARYLGFS